MSDLKHYAAVAVVAVLLLVFMYANSFSGDGLLPSGGGSPTGGEVTACNGAPLELSGAQRELLELHNETCGENGVPELCYQEDLANAAQVHSEDMLERDYFSHDTPDDREPSDRMLAAGYDQDGYRSWQVTENIYKVTGPSADPDREALEGVVDGWMESPGHRENILKPELREVGFGVASGGFAGTYEETALYTANFGARK